MCTLDLTIRVWKCFRYLKSAVSELIGESSNVHTHVCLQA